MDLGNAAAFGGRRRISQRRDSLIASLATGPQSEDADASIEITTPASLTEYVADYEARLNDEHHTPLVINAAYSSDPPTMALSKDKVSDLVMRPQHVYTNLCTDNDPPYSVATSPTRHCTAFGCKSGVELYWVCHAI